MISKVEIKRALDRAEGNYSIGMAEAYECDEVDCWYNEYSTLEECFKGMITKELMIKGIKASDELVKELWGIAQTIK